MHINSHSLSTSSRENESSKKSDSNPTIVESSSSSKVSEESGDSAVNEITWSEGIRDRKKLWILIKRMPRDLVEWARHFWSGCKLLAADVRVSWKIFKRILGGKELSRRERNLLVSTGADLARLVPFSFFLIVPFMEFALPFALKLFPNMLPSQFQDKMKKEEDLRRQLQLRLELAKYLQDVVEEKAKVIKASSSKDDKIKEEAEKLTEFLDALRSGKQVDERDVLYFARLFSDEYTIEGAVRPQLVAMCQYMGISPYGSDAFLRMRLRSRLASIKQDDMQINWEGGVASLTDEEVAKACRERGIRTSGITKRRMRAQLRDWIEMSQNREVPASLMIISRVFFYTQVPQTALKQTLGSLPQDVLDDVKGARQSESSLSSEERLQEVKRQEKILEMESERERRSEEEKRKKREASEAAEEKKRKEQELEAEAAAAAEAQASAAAGAPESATASAGWEETPDIQLKEQQMADQMIGGNVPAATASADGMAPIYKGEVGEVSETQQQVSGESEEAAEAATAESAEQKQDYSAVGGMIFVKPDKESAKGEEVTAAPAQEPTEEVDATLLQEQIKSISRTLLLMMDESSVTQERLALETLKAELREATAHLDSGKEDRSIRRLRNMVKKLEKEIERVDATVGVKMKLLDADNDGVIGDAEIREALELFKQAKEMQFAADTIMSRLMQDQLGVSTYSKDDCRKSLRALISEYSGGAESPKESSS